MRLPAFLSPLSLKLTGLSLAGLSRHVEEALQAPD
jgi:hypothetical protein